MNQPQTRAERTQYGETSTYTDVMAFVDALFERASVHVETLGTSSQGRALPLLVLSHPRVTTPAEARALGRPVVYVQANIHAGEVEGKEAVLALARDLSANAGANVLDHVVLIVVPIYNADGNEAFKSQSVNRAEQNGPEQVGQRPNGMGLDLNRDYLKAEAPETRASLVAFARWNPDVFVDLHTSDGSYHGYALTYSPSLDPAATFGGRYAADVMLPAIRERMRSEHHFETFDYGNFSQTFDDDLLHYPKPGWFTYDWRPRFGTNYFGLRGRISILSEAFSHDDFQIRVGATRAFVEEILTYTGVHANDILALGRRADAALAPSASPPSVPLRAQLDSHPPQLPVLVERLEAGAAGVRLEAGLPVGIKRTRRFESQTMPVVRAYEAILSRPLPRAYALDRVSAAVLDNLRLHGIAIESTMTAHTATVESFSITARTFAPSAFQGHQTLELEGRWSAAVTSLPTGTLIVRTSQPLGLVALRLLEPQSGDGLVTWNFFDEAPVGTTFPVRRVIALD